MAESIGILKVIISYVSIGGWIIMYSRSIGVARLSQDIYFNH